MEKFSRVRAVQRKLKEVFDRHGVVPEPFADPKPTFEAISAGHRQTRIDDLLTWSLQPSS